MSGYDRSFLYLVCVFLFIFLPAILFVYFFLIPTKPRFVLQDVTVLKFNATHPKILESSFQLKLYSQNPNKLLGIYYDRLGVDATYCGQPITSRAAIRNTYQGHKEADIWSPSISGTSIPISPVNATSPEAEQWNGGVALMIRVEGRVRWKLGSITMGGDHLSVQCPAFINVGDKAARVPVGKNAVKCTLVTQCRLNG